MILTANDFIGSWQIPLNGINTAVLDSFIEECEKRYLNALLGGDLYYNLTQGLSENTTLTKWSSLVNGMDYKYEADFDDKYVYENFRGLKKMLLCFTWSEYMINTRNQVNIVGMQQPNVENGITTPNADFTRAIEQMFNTGLEIYKEAIIFITRMNFDTDIVSINGNEVTLNYAKLFEGGEEIEIGGYTYTVEEVSGNVLTLDTEPNGTTIVYLFYRNFVHSQIKKMSSF